MPRLPASVAAAAPWSPLTAARPAPGDTHNTFPPSAATCAAKSAGTEPLKETMYRWLAAVPPRVATEANCGPRAAAAGSVGWDGMRASYVHAAVATNPTVASRGIDLTSDTGASQQREMENMSPIGWISKQRTDGLTSPRKSSRTRDRGP